MRTRAVALTIPLAGLASFAGLMAVALARFPGGNRFHPAAAGFDFFDNFWCDLFDERTYAGLVNEGRGWAIAASVVLFVAMIPLWWELPRSFTATPRLVRPTQIAGTLAMLAATLVPTPLHDAAIFAAGPLGGVAYVMTLFGLWRHERRVLALLGLLPLALSTANFSLWAGQIWVHAIPAVQKLALGSFLLWVAALAGALRRGGVAKS